MALKGGQNSYSIRISEKPVNAPAMRADVLLALNYGASVEYGPLIQTDGILIAEKKIRDRIIAIAFSDIAEKELGNKIYANTVETGERIATGILYRAAPRKPFADRFRKEITDLPFAEVKPVSPEKISGFMSGLRSRR